MKKSRLYLKVIGRLLLHFIFWCGILFFHTYYFAYGTDNLDYAFSFSIFLLPITVATSYVSIYILIPKYLLLKKYIRFGLYSIYTFIISAYLIMISIFYGLIYLSGFKVESMSPISKSLMFVVIGVYLIVVAVSALKLLQHNYLSNSKNARLENKILETQLKLKEQELQYLKMQIHPHFLFNTLNTMYGFAIKKADETPEMILKLSNLLDYLLYQVDKPFVALMDEVNHIKDYIALEQLRFNDTLDISFNTNTIPDSVKVPPMLLLPFVENSFKHGVLKNGLLTITIDLKCSEKNLQFVIKNNNDSETEASNGIGLKNITKRLNHLYENNYKLNISNTNNIFKVNLNIEFENE